MLVLERGLTRGFRCLLGWLWADFEGLFWVIGGFFLRATRPLLCSSGGVER